MITPEERERAYERYELYRDARAHWEMNTIIIGFLDVIGGAVGGYIGLSLSRFRFWPTIIGVCLGSFAVHLIIDFFMTLSKTEKSKKLTLADLDAVKGIDGVWADGNHVEFEIPREQADKIIDRINEEARAKGLAIKINKRKKISDENDAAALIDEKEKRNEAYGKLTYILKNKAEYDANKNKRGDMDMSKVKGESTKTGYINKNNQRNNGKTDEPGTGNLQWFYEMECLNCGYKYKANGHDIWLRKCPNCQGGKP